MSTSTGYNIHQYVCSTLPMQKGLFQLIVAIHSPPFYIDREGRKLSTTEWQLFQKIIFLKSLTLRISEPQESIKAFVRQVSCTKVNLCQIIQQVLTLAHAAFPPLKFIIQ